jgi:hypothetical protein
MAPDKLVIVPSGIDPAEFSGNTPRAIFDLQSGVGAVERRRLSATNQNKDSTCAPTKCRG